MGGAADDTCGDIVGPGKGRLGPRTYLQPFGDPQPLASPPAWRRMPGKEPRLSASMDGLRDTRIGQTHNDISGPIIGQMRLDQFALQSVKRTTTQPERLLVKRTTTQPERLLVKRTTTQPERL